jgi:hydroxyacylglutathione hydrolase
VTHIELGKLPAASGDVGEVDAVMCGHGERATTAASLLEQAGHHRVAVVVGGPEDWSAHTGQPLTTQ